LRLRNKDKAKAEVKVEKAGNRSVFAWKASRFVKTSQDKSPDRK